MKKIVHAMASAILLLLLSGCEKETMSYEGEVGVYFAVQRGNTWGSEVNWPFYPYSVLEFVMQGTKSQHTIGIKVRVTGNLSDQPRVFKYEIDPQTTTATEGVDYIKPSGEGVIPAGQRDGYIDLVVNRTSTLETQELCIGFMLVANENFTLAFTQFDQPPGMNVSSEEIISQFDASKHIVRVNDILVQPPVWLGGIYQYGNFEEFNVLGVFSPKKFNLICDITGVTYSDFLTNPPMTTSYMNIIGRRVAAYLKEQYRNHTPVLENDGRLMWVDTCGWTSYPGIPWDGTFNPDYYY